MDATYYHNLATLKSLAPGDLVEINRGAYSHWAVYIGNKKIVHLAGIVNDGISKPKHVFSVGGKQFNKAEVCKEDFWKVAKGCRATKNNDKDTTWEAMHPREVVDNALSKLGEIGYNVLFSNCEHFAKWCRYGKKESDQVRNPVRSARRGGAYAIEKVRGKEKDEDERQRHKAGSAPAQTRDYRCDICWRPCKSSPALRIHMLSHR